MRSFLASKDAVAEVDNFCFGSGVFYYQVLVNQKKGFEIGDENCYVVFTVQQIIDQTEVTFVENRCQRFESSSLHVDVLIVIILPDLFPYLFVIVVIYQNLLHYDADRLPDLGVLVMVEE